MRILYFSSDYTPHDYRFLSALAETEHQVYFLRLEHNLRQTEERPVPPNIKQVQWMGGKKLFSWRDLPRLTHSLREVIHNIKPDLVHAGPIQTCAFLVVLTGFRPLMTMSWGFDLMQDANRNVWWKTVTRYTLKRSTFFTSDCEATRDRAITFGMNPAHTMVFPWGVDLQHFKLSTLNHTLSKGFTIFCNRAWEPRYGLDVLANAFVKLAALYPDISLLLLGGGSQELMIRQIFKSAGILDRVIFAGQVSQDELRSYYYMADLFISPSHVDGSSVSLMEALACGLPCLVSDIPANKEWVLDGVNGWLFPDGDAGTLASKISAIVNNRENLKEISLHARSPAEKKADWKKNFPRLLDAYEQTVRLNV